MPFAVAKELLVCHHYLHSLPGGTKLAFGMFVGARLMGVLTLGCGPANVHCLVEGATPAEGLTLTRLWLADELPRNSESRLIGLSLRALRARTTDYERERRFLEDRLAGLVVPEVDAAREAGRLLEDLPRLWGEAGLSERRRLLTTMLDAVYIETREERRVVAIRPRPAFRSLLEIATTREGSGVILVKEQPPAEGSEANISGGSTPVGAERLCSWWRRGRVEPGEEHGKVLLAAA